MELSKLRSQPQPEAIEETGEYYESKDSSPIALKDSPSFITKNDYSIPTMSSAIIKKSEFNKSKKIKNNLFTKTIRNINHLIHNLTKDLKKLKLKFKTLKLMIHKPTKL